MIQQFNNVINYVESHLMEDISKDQISKIAGVSDYHFRKLFLFISGLTLHDYIKQRRFTLANAELIAGASVTEVSFKYGYQSLEGFSRAFKEWSGYLPSAIYENQIQKTFSRLSFVIDIKGGISMEVKIEKKEPFNLIGVTCQVPIQFEGVNSEIMALANSITPQQRAELNDLKDLYPLQVINASYNFAETRLEEKGTLTHLIGVVTSQETLSADFAEVKVPSHTWAIFPNKGPYPQTLQETWQQIYGEWLPSTNYELVEAPEISFSRFEEPENDRYSEIWLAVKEK